MPDHCTTEHYFMMLLLSLENWNYGGMTHFTTISKLENEELAFTFLITVHFLKKKKALVPYLKDSEVKVIDSEVRTTRV